MRVRVCTREFVCTNSIAQLLEHMCTVGRVSFAIDWQDLYEDENVHSILPLCRRDRGVKHSGTCRTMCVQPDIALEDGSMVLWRKSYCFGSSMLFNGRVIMDHGNVEVRVAFKFPASPGNIIIFR